MAKRRGTNPDLVDQLQLSEGDWIEVKRELSVGDSRTALSHAITGISRDGDTYRVDPALQDLATTANRIVRWSFIDQTGAPMPWERTWSLKRKIDALDKLDADTKAEIDAAFTHYDAKRALEKKSHDGASASVAISPSAE
jgi:hypothetical protein